MYYSDDLVEEVRSRNDIVDVISGYVKLKKQGSNYFGLCPFHNEKSPSFSVSQPKQMFHCFGCGEGGNVFTFLMKYENSTFPEALQTLADRAGVDLPKQELSEEQKREQSRKARLFELNKAAAKYFYAFMKTPQGELGRNYFDKRKLNSETISQFGLGYAGAGARLYDYLKDQGFDDELIRESGLVTYDEKYGIQDRFWNRVMFPIMDVNNKVIGFGGRVLGDAKPKYLNSSENRIFDKGRNLYGLNKAKSSRSDSIIVCEGYMDVISLHQAGFTQAVATLGTAMTTGHASLLRRYTEDVLLIYDSDEAGIKAALRAIPRCREAGISCRVVNLSPYKDPDEFIKNLGADEFKKRLDNAENGFLFELDIEKTKHNLSDPDGQTKFHNEVARRISSIDEDIERENYISAAAARYGIGVDVLRKTVARAAASSEGSPTYERPRTGLSQQSREKEDGVLVAQKLLLTWLVEESDIFSQVSQYIQPEDYTGEMYGKVAGALYEQLRNGKLNPSAIVSMFDEEEEHRQVSAIFNTKLDGMEAKSEREKAVSDLVIKIKRNSLMSSHAVAEGADPLEYAIRQKRELDELRRIHITLS